MNTDCGCNGAALSRLEISRIQRMLALDALQRDIVSALMEGRPPEQIARDLGIGPGRLRTHLEHTYRRLQISSLMELNALIRRILGRDPPSGIG